MENIFPGVRRFTHLLPIFPMVPPKACSHTAAPSIPNSSQKDRLTCPSHKLYGIHSNGIYHIQKTLSMTQKYPYSSTQDKTIKCKHDLVRIWLLLHFRIVAHMLTQQNQPKCFHLVLKSFRVSFVILVSALQKEAEIKLLFLLHKIHMAHCYCRNTISYIQ